MRPQARLSIILGMDVMHWAPRLVDQFKDKHGFLALYACKLSKSLIPMGNRQFPYMPAEAQSALSQDTSNFSVSTTCMEEEEGDFEDLPHSTIFHGVTNDYPLATRVGPKCPLLQFLNCPEEVELPASHNLATSVRPPAFGDQRAVAGTATASPPTTRSFGTTPSPLPAASSSPTSSGSPSTSSPSLWGSTTASTTTAASAATAAPITSSPTLNEPGAAENHPMGEANEWSEEKEVFEDVQLEAKKADIEKFIACGVVSKNLLEVL